MNRILRIVMIVGLITLVGIQFIPADVNQQSYIPKTDLRYVYDVPDNVMNILQTSCYDCHSNNTNYPWYSKIQPFRYFLDNHIQKGKEKLNFNEFMSYSARRKKNKLKSIISQIKNDEMPLDSYTLTHSNAKLKKEDKKLIFRSINKLIYK